MESGFFNVYTKFEKFRLDYHQKIASIANGDEKFMKEVTEKHFFAQHIKKGAVGAEGFTCDFADVLDDDIGTHAAIIACVQLHGEKKTTKYYVKSHDRETASSKGSRRQAGPVSLKEIFAYLMLKQTEMGPPPQFAFPEEKLGCTTSMYFK